MPFTKGQRAHNKGTVKPELAPTLHPTNMDIAWAAGVYEGEGTCSASSTRRSTWVMVSQKDAWLCPKLRDLFGGRIRIYKAYCNGPGSEYREYHRWDLCGPRALGFLQTIYSFLSPRRQGQIKVALDAVRQGA